MSRERNGGGGGVVGGRGKCLISARLTSLNHHSLPGPWRNREAGVPDASPQPSPCEGWGTETGGRAQEWKRK